MSLRGNVIINVVGQGYAAAIGIVMVPVYVRWMGTDSFGLIGFFSVLQVAFQLFDLGVTPTISRQIARSRAGALPHDSVAKLVRSAELYCALAAAFLAAATSLAAPWLATEWLTSRTLGQDEIVSCVMMMGWVAALRSLAGLYRGGLLGLEHVMLLNLANAGVATVRSVGVVAVLAYGTADVSAFFAYQVGAALLECALMALLFYRRFPMVGALLRFDIRAFRAVLGLAGSIAFLNTIWVVISQADRTILSWTLDLREFGHFVVATTLSGGILLLSSPIQQVLQARFSWLAATEDRERLTLVFRRSTQATSAGLFSVAAVMAMFAEPLLLAWTEDPELAREGARILPQYAVGNAISGLLGITFQVQFATGRIRPHVIGNLVFALMWIPGALLASTRGAAAMGWVWCVGNLLFLVFWIPRALWVVMPATGWRWLLHDIAVPTLVIAAGAVLARQAGLPHDGRWAVGATLLVAGTILAFAGILAGRETRSLFLAFVTDVLRAHRQRRREIP